MDNFDLKKFLKESKAIENLNPSIKAINEGEAAYEYEKGKKEGEAIEKKKMTKEAMKKQIKDMIVAELEGKDLEDATKQAEKGNSTDLALHMAGIKELELDIDNPGKDSDADLYDPVYEDNDPGEEEADMMDAYADGGFLDEAKKDKEEDVEDVEVTDTEEEVPAEEVPAEEAPAGGLEDIAADMEGTEGDLMDHLMKAFQIAKGMGNEKLETQVGNTLKFFVSEYIGGGEG
jgi:hypothetical protein